MLTELCRGAPRKAGQGLSRPKAAVKVEEPSAKDEEASVKSDGSRVPQACPQKMRARAQRAESCPRRAPLAWLQVAVKGLSLIHI